MSEPFHIIGSPLTLYVAEPGTAFPTLDDTPARFDPAWFLIGTDGAKDYDEAGVTVTHSDSLNYFRGAGSTGPRKAFRTEEDLTVGITLADLSPEQYAKQMNDAAVRTVAADVGRMGTREFQLLKGLKVVGYSLLARGISALDEELPAQYEVPLAVQSGSPAPVYTKGNAALLECTWTSLEHATLGFGRLIQGAVAARTS
jgi:hypothetical protein